MKLEGIHHITAITENGQKNVDFYVGVMGMRLVKKTVNQDQPTVYHLFYADEKGSAGADLTFFEFPGTPKGRAGEGMVRGIQHRVASEDALAFWEKRLSEHGVENERAGESLRFWDPEGLGHALTVDTSGDQPLRAEHPEIPEEMALQGFNGALAVSSDPDRSKPLLEEALGFEPMTGGDGHAGWAAQGDERVGYWGYAEPPEEPGIQGAGSVHHIAWASKIEDHEKWREKVIEAGLQPTPVIDRFYFKSIYFREPSGVLFEIATLGPGFTVDEPLESLGEKLSLPPDFEHMREKVEPNLRPIVNPRTAAKA